MSGSRSPSFKNSYDPGSEEGIAKKALARIEETLRTGLRTSAEPVLQLLDRADVKSGNISLVQRAKLTWSSAEMQDLPSKVVLKLPTAVKMKAELSKFMDKKTLDHLTEEQSVIEKGHNAECNAYDLLEAVPGIKLARHFGHQYCKEAGNYDGFLILEDLTETSRVVDFIQGLNLNQVHAAVDNLAALHAYSLTSDHWHRKIGQVMTMDLLVKYMKMGENTCRYMQTNFKETFQVPSSDLSIILNPLRYKFMTTTEDNKYPVVMHGDFWINNLLFKYDPSTDRITDELVAIIDWQSVHKGTIGEDLARLLASSVPTDIRRSSLNQIIGRYYTTLQSILMEKNELVPFSMKDISDGYQQAFPYVAVFMVGVSAIYLDKDKERSQEDREALVRRVREVVEDAVKIGRTMPVPKVPEAED